ncbi:10071_t:CDS:2, partial [Ambispora leptoticha]
EAKEYSNYYGGVLKPEEKSIFDMVNGIGSNKPIDKVVSQFEDIFFAESEYEFDHKEEE